MAGVSCWNGLLATYCKATAAAASRESVRSECWAANACVIPAAISAAAELSRTLKPKIQQAADTLGFDAADQAALFAVDYSTHANAWEALQAAAANRAAAAIDNGDRIE